MKSSLKNDEKEYCTAMDGLRFSAEAKAQMTKGLVNIQETPVKKSQPIRRVVVAAVACVLVAALAVGAGATGVLKSVKEAFAPFLGEKVAQTEIIDKIGHPIGASSTSNGITMTADAIIGDKYNACVIYTLTKDDGSRFLPEGVSPDEMSINGFTYLMGETGGSGSSRFFDKDPGDNEIQYMDIIGSDAGEFQFGNVKASFTEIYFYPKGNLNDSSSLVNIKPVTLAKGNWDMRFEVAYEDSSVALSSGEVTQYAGWDCTIRELTISSLGFHVVLETDLEAWKNETKESELGAQPVPKIMDSTSLVSIPVQVKKADGSMIDFSDSAGGGMGEKDGKTVAYRGGIFSEIIPLEEIESITINDVEYPVNP